MILLFYFILKWKKKLYSILKWAKKILFYFEIEKFVFHFILNSKKSYFISGFFFSNVIFSTFSDQKSKIFFEIFYENNSIWSWKKLYSILIFKKNLILLYNWKKKSYLILRSRKKILFYFTSKKSLFYSILFYLISGYYFILRPV